MHVCVLTLYIILVFFVYNEGSSKSCLSFLNLKGVFRKAACHPLALSFS